ncbi:MAG TPA: CoA transferase, partial [Gemmatimonadaceae bacterium]
VLAALDRQRRTGEGAFIDLAQYETGLFFIGGALLDFHRRGVVTQRAANADRHAAPHDAYPCRNGEWLAVSCWTEDEFRSLAEVIERPDLADDPRFSTRDSRQLHLAELDPILAAWTSTQDSGPAAARLQAAGVHAHPVHSVGDLFRDPQLAFRRVWRSRRHQAMGDLSCYFSAFDLSATPGDVRSAAPCLGADNDYVFGELLGLAENELSDLRASGAFG